MKFYKLTDAESKLAEIIWQDAPISSAELVRLCQERFEWKKSTTYTMLKRLEEKHLFENQNGTVIAILTKEDYEEEQSKQFVSHTFEGSLPKFLTAFTRHKRLSENELVALQQLIDTHKEG